MSDHASKDASHEVIDPPDDLSGKVGPEGSLDPEAVERAESAISEMRESFVTEVAEHVERLRKAAAAAAGGPEACEEELRTAYETARDLRDRADTFGFVMITSISRLLCRYLEGAHERARADVDVVNAHADALRAVVAHGVTGDGGDLGRELIEGLEILVTRNAA